jgi:hypothetical protein
MDHIIIEPTGKTPAIDFNQLTGDLILSGKSIPENAAKIYEPLFNWVVDYIKNPKPVTNLRLNLEYFNTATSLWLTKIVKELCSINDMELTLFIHIYFSIEDFDSLDNIKDDIIELTNPIISSATLSVGYKIYGIDDDGNIIKESLVLV